MWLPGVEKEELIEDLKRVKFSILVDESTDCGNEKNMVLLTKYTCPRTGKPVTALLDIIELDSKDCTAAALWQKVNEVLVTKCEIPLTNLIGMACDHANVMWGSNNSFMTRLKEACPWAVVIDCVCHSSHIAASKACKKLPPMVQNTVRRLASYTSGSPKHSAILEEFQGFYSEQKLRLLRPIITRWLVMHPCVVRTLDNETALQHYLQYCCFEDPKDTEAHSLLKDLRNPFFKVYLLFLKYALEYFNQLNALFKSEKTLIHKLQSASRRLLKQVCQNYTRENVLDSVHKSNFDTSNPHFQLRLANIYLDPGVQEALAAIPLPDNPDGKLTEQQRTTQRSHDIHTVRLKCLDFYITAAAELKRYLPLNSAIIKESVFIDPAVATSTPGTVA